MKVVHVYMDTEEYEKLRTAKENLGLTWRQFLLKLLELPEVPEYGKTEHSQK